MGTELLEELKRFDPECNDNNTLKKRIRRFKRIVRDIGDWIPEAYGDPKARAVLFALTPILGLYISRGLEGLIKSGQKVNPDEKAIAALKSVSPPSKTLNLEVFSSFHATVTLRINTIDRLIPADSGNLWDTILNYFGFQ
ncbi:MAG: hypothetical protein P9L99_19985 [Candidatus Lernaella stagnicola]|nr:hypothetical protein [Candidatus Lernaella stagnicola]